MKIQQTVLSKKRRGPAPTGKGTLVGVRLQPKMLSALDRFIGDRETKLTRPEAVRVILADRLKVKGKSE